MGIISHFLGGRGRGLLTFPPPPPPVAQKVDNAIHLAPDVQTLDLINLDPLDNAIDFHNTYLSESDLSSGQHYPTLEQPGPEQDSLIYLLKKKRLD